MASKRGREILPGDMAIYLVRRCSRQSLGEAGRDFGLRSYRTVSRAVERIRARSKEEYAVRTQLEKLKVRLHESQQQAPFHLQSSSTLMHVDQDGFPLSMNIF